MISLNEFLRQPQPVACEECGRLIAPEPEPALCDECLDLFLAEIEREMADA